MSKKTIKLTSVLLLVVVLFSGCRRNGGVLSCAAATSDYVQELNAYLGNQTKNNCERLVKSIQDIYKGCSALTDVDREEYEEIEEDLDCDSL